MFNMQKRYRKVEKNILEQKRSFIMLNLFR